MQMIDKVDSVGDIVIQYFSKLIVFNANVLNLFTLSLRANVGSVAILLNDFEIASLVVTTSSQ